MRDAPFLSVLRLDTQESKCLPTFLNFRNQLQRLTSSRKGSGMLTYLRKRQPLIPFARVGPEHLMIWNSLDVPLEGLVESVAAFIKVFKFVHGSLVLDLVEVR